MATFYLVGSGGNVPLAPYSTTATAANTLKQIFDYSGFVDGDTIEVIYHETRPIVENQYYWNDWQKSFILKSWSGNGNNKPVIQHNVNSTMPLFRFNNGGLTNTEIYNIKFIENSTTYNHPFIYFQGNTGTPSSDCIISGCDFVCNSTSVGSESFVVKTDALTNFKFINNSINNFYGGITSPTMNRNVEIINNVFYNVTIGIDCRPNCRNLDIINNIFYTTDPFSTGIYVVEANAGYLDGYDASIIDYNDMYGFSTGYSFVPTGGSTYITSPGLHSSAISPDFISTTTFQLTSASSLTSGGYPEPYTPMGLLYTYQQASSGTSGTIALYGGSNIMGTINYGDVRYPAYLTCLASSTGPYASTLNFTWTWTDITGIRYANGLWTSAELYAGTYPITLIATNAVGEYQTYTISATINPPSAVSAVTIPELPTPNSTKVFIMQDSVFKSTKTTNVINTDMLQYQLGSDYRAIIEFNNNTVNFNNNSINSHTGTENVKVNVRDCQFGWTPPTDANWQFVRYSVMNDMPTSATYQYLLDNKQLLIPFDGIAVPPNPGYGTSAYVEYDKDLYGNNRIDYTLPPSITILQDIVVVIGD